MGNHSCHDCINFVPRVTVPPLAERCTLKKRKALPDELFFAHYKRCLFAWKNKNADLPKKMFQWTKAKDSIIVLLSLLSLLLGIYNVKSAGTKKQSDHTKQIADSVNTFLLSELIHKVKKLEEKHDSIVTYINGLTPDIEKISETQPQSNSPNR
jgi:hypothetical protein